MVEVIIQAPTLGLRVGLSGGGRRGGCCLGGWMSRSWVKSSGGPEGMGVLGSGASWGLMAVMSGPY